MELFLLVILVILFVATYFFFNKAYIPIKEAVVAYDNLSNNTLGTVYGVSTGSLKLSVSFAIYIIAVFSWFGWYLLPSFSL